MTLLLLKAILAGLFFFFGTAAAAAICAALAGLGERASRWRWQRRGRIAEREKRVRSIMSATALLDPPGRDAACRVSTPAPAQVPASPFVVEISPEMVIDGRLNAVLQQTVCEMKAGQRRYLFRDYTAEVN